MKYIKYSFLIAIVLGFSSCLKNSRDVGGLLTDKGTILTTISEKAYLNTDAQNIGFGYDHTTANFNFTKRPTESVKFFTLKISQPRENKMNGPLVIKVAITGISNIGNVGPVTPLPASAITATDITVPASTNDLIVVPVFFTVNKAALDAANTYGVNFKLTSVNQGAISVGDGNIDVAINYSDNAASLNTSDYEANYTYKSSIVDPSGIIGLNNVKTMYLIQTSPTTLEYVDEYAYAFGSANRKFLLARNFSTGVLVALFRPRFTIDGSGKVTGVSNVSPSSSITNLTLDPAGVNQFVYTSNNTRTLSVKYSFTYTSTANGVTPRTIKVSEDFSYDPDQIYY